MMVGMQFSKAAEAWLPWMVRGLRVLVILALAWVASRLVRRLLKRVRPNVARMMDRHRASTPMEIDNRVSTIVSTLGKLSSLFLWLAATVMALNELTFHIEPLLAGLGVAGLAFGLGAQTLIKDLLGGLFLLLEDQIRIGDAVTINGISGSVEEINFRTTVVRAENGAVHIIPNGSIQTLANLTREFSYYVFETTLAHRADADRALAILQTVGTELAKEEAFHGTILEPMEVYGVEKLGERGALIKGRIKTLPTKQANVGRELNRRVKARLDAEGIAFPPPP